MMPFWNNFHLLFGRTRRPLTKLSKNNGLSQAHGICRQRDFVVLSGSFATHEVIKSLWDDEDFARPASKTRFVNQFLPRISLLLGDSPTISIGPRLPPQLESAFHDWSLDGHLVGDMKNKDFVELALKASKSLKTPDLHLAQLNVADVWPADDMWNNEYGWDHHVLPVAADVKIRLQHNTLGFRYKFQWRTRVDTSSTCIRGCDHTSHAP